MDVFLFLGESRNPVDAEDEIRKRALAVYLCDSLGT